MLCRILDLVGGCEHYNGNVQWLQNFKRTGSLTFKIPSRMWRDSRKQKGILITLNQELYTLIYRGHLGVFVRASKQSINHPHLYLLKHDYMFRSVQTVIEPPLQNFQNKAQYSAIIIHTTGSCMCYSSYYKVKLYKNCPRFVVS